MKKRHLWWIIPLTLVIGFLLGFKSMEIPFNNLIDNYDMVACIVSADMVMLDSFLPLAFTEESMRKAIELRCTKEFVDLDKTFDETLVFNSKFEKTLFPNTED